MPAATDESSNGADSSNQEEKPSFDLEQISRQVYQLIRRRLKVEQERIQGRGG
jgi:hypothetical protein